jgi:uncharacterized repeat protein (TIGR01451 family)
MQSFKQHTRRVALAVVALSLGGLAPSAFAATIDTNFDTTVVNRASVNYSVSGVPQTVIRSAPGGGNSTPGAGGGSDTTFKVDKKLMFLAEETNSAATVTSPGLNNVVAVFRVTNNSNGAQDFQLNPSNPTAPPAIPALFAQNYGDNFDMTNLRARVSNAACSSGAPTTPAYAGETTAYIEQLGEDACKYVFILSDTPLTATVPAVVNGATSVVKLEVRPTTDVSNGVTPEAPTAAADDPLAVEAVFAESGNVLGNQPNDGYSFAYDVYLVGTLTVSKSVAVISDGFTLVAANAKAIPGATMEYTITVSNDGLVTSGATLTEAIPANTTYVAGSTTLNGASVADVAGAMPYVNPGAINSPGQAAGVILANTTLAQRAVVKFRVTIN